MGRAQGKTLDQFADIMGTRRGLRPGQKSSVGSGYTPTPEQEQYVDGKLVHGALELPLFVALGERLGETVIMLKASKPGRYFYVHENGVFVESTLSPDTFPATNDSDLALALLR